MVLAVMGRRLGIVPLDSMKARSLLLPSIVSSSIALLGRGFTVAAATEVTTEDSIRGAYYGSLVADALCLGSHYEYDSPKIKQAYNGNVIDEFMAPGEQMGGETHGVGWGARNYHPGTIKVGVHFFYLYIVCIVTDDRSNTSHAVYFSILFLH